MKIYAVLNENNICTAISQLSGEVILDYMIEITEFSEDFIWKKYTSGVWSIEKFEPISTAPLSDFERMDSTIARLEALNTISNDNFTALTDALIEMGVI